jgi:hypothetical protein
MNNTGFSNMEKNESPNWAYIPPPFRPLNLYRKRRDLRVDFKRIVKGLMLIC